MRPKSFGEADSLACDEPICDAARGLLDGHIILSRSLAAAGHYPAIDILNSVSRLSTALVASAGRQRIAKVREALAGYSRAEDLISLGAHVRGANPKLDASIDAHDAIVQFLRQDVAQLSPLVETEAGLESVAALLP